MALADVALHRSFLRRKWRARPPSLRRLNNLSPAIGLLELSNALDFAANVWNAIPPPPIALVFMALGATGALALLVWATFDFPRAWRNFKLLRKEKQQLKSRSQSAETEEEVPYTLSERDIAIYHDMNTREFGNETIDRLAMYVLLGFGAFTVGIGTYMAMGGVDQIVFLASNIITGYLGNVPAALYGLLNAGWCVYGYMRSRRHEQGVLQHLQQETSNAQLEEMAHEIKRYSRGVRIHALMNGFTGICGGAGSLMTASTYIHSVGVWGYVILLPCAISSLITNLFWRHRIYYDRDITTPEPVNPDQVLDDAIYALKVRDLLSSYRHNVYGHKPLPHLRKDKYDEAAFRTLLNTLNSIALEHMTLELNRLSAKTTVSDEEKSEDTSEVVSDPYSAEKIQSLQTRIARLNESLQRLRQPTTQPEKRFSLDNLIRESCSILESLDLFPTFCQRMANSKDLQLLAFRASSNSRPNTSSGLQIEESRLLQSILAETVLENTKLEFLKLTTAVLADEGAERARSRVRYYCEYSGCVFGRALT